MEKLLSSIMFFSALIFLIFASCKVSYTNKIIVYSEGIDFNLSDEISQGFGYDSIKISKGEYPVSYDKKKNGQISLKVLSTYGNGNETKTRTAVWKGKNYYNPRTGLRCRGWGFSCKGDGPLIDCRYTLTSDNLLVVEFLKKVPFGSKGFETE